MSKKINITIVGAAGKMGCELIRQIKSYSSERGLNTQKR